jgi:hypothetical protein
MFSPAAWTMGNWLFAGLLFGLQLLAVRCFHRLRLLPALLACVWICIWLFEAAPAKPEVSHRWTWRVETQIADIVAPSFIPALALLTTMVLGCEIRRRPPSADSALPIPPSAFP